MASSRDSGTFGCDIFTNVYVVILRYRCKPIHICTVRRDDCRFPEHKIDSRSCRSMLMANTSYILMCISGSKELVLLIFYFVSRSVTINKLITLAGSIRYPSFMASRPSNLHQFTRYRKTIILASYNTYLQRQFCY